MKKTAIPRRGRSDALYAKYNPTGDPFFIPDTCAFDNPLLYGMGLGIYWGEGNKASKHVVSVSNTDPNILDTFKRFLLEICHVKPEKIKMHIVCFNDSDCTEVATYWSNIFGMKKTDFGKIVVIPTQGKGTYLRKSRYGVCSINVYNMKLKQWILHAINDFDRLDSLVGKHLLGKKKSASPILAPGSSG